MIDSQNDLGDGRSCHRFDKTCAGANDAGMLGFRSDHKARHILNEEQRRVVAITGLDKVSDFFRRFGVNNAAELWRAAGGIAKHPARIRNYADLNSAHSRMTGNDFLRIVRLKLVEMSIIEHAIQQVASLVRLAVILGNNLVDLFFGSFRMAPALDSGRRSLP